MLQRLIVLAVFLVSLFAIASPALTVEPETDAANAALDYIATLQNDDGGFIAFGEESSPGSTIDAVFALAALGRDPASFASGAGNTPVDYLSVQAADYASDPGSAAKLMLAVAVLGLDPSDFGGVDLVAITADSYDAKTGVYGLDLFDEALYILALVAAGAPVPEELHEHLGNQRATDGGWEFSPGGGSDSNTTAMVAQALVAAGSPRDDHAVGSALAYVKSTQQPDGGFAFLPGGESDPNSTALAIQAIVASGEDPDLDSRWAVEGNTPLAALVSFQNPETGAFQFAGEDSPFATYQAVPALVLAPLPDLQPRFAAQPEPTDPAPTEPAAPAAVTATPAPPVLPASGTGAGDASGAPWALAMLAAAGLLALAGGVALRKER